MVNSLVSLVKSLVLPKGRRKRKLRFGPAAGSIVNLDLQHELRLFLGLYEKELEPYFRRLVAKGDRSFDVGGQYGYDALMLAKLSGAPVVSIELDKDAAADMRQNFGMNSEAIEVVEAFVGGPGTAGALTLDQLARDTFVPDFIKIDIEGGEADALEGAREILGRRRPKLIVEVHAKEQEEACLRILREFGYTPQIVDQRKWFREHRPIAHNRWLICHS